MDITLQFSAQSVKSGGILAALGSWAIRTWTWCPYSHVDIVLPDGRWLGARMSGGVQIRDPYPVSRAVRLACDMPDDFLDVAKSMVGRKYNWLPLIGIPLHLDLGERGEEFCDQFVLEVAHKVGRPLLRGKPSILTPRDLLLSPLLQRAG